MATIRIQNPFQFFTEVDGSPLDYGKVYIGDENQDAEANPKAVYWDKALTVPASQPLTTVAGYIYNGNSPATAYTDGAYSMTVRDARDVLVVSVTSSTTTNHEDDTEAHGATGAVVGTTNTQTLTNKTLTTPTVGDFTNANHDHGDAAGGGAIDFTGNAHDHSDAANGGGVAIGDFTNSQHDHSDAANGGTLGLPGTWTSAANADATTITDSFTTCETLSLGTVAANEVFLINAKIAATKGATAGEVAAMITSGGGATYVFASEGAVNVTTLLSGYQVEANDAWYATISGILKTTGSGTLALSLDCLSAGSNSTASQASMTGIRIK